MDDLSKRYVGGTAAQYEHIRASGKKWAAENRAVEQLLTCVPEGSRILDVPVGTGRFIPYYKDRHFETYGIDASADMIAQARARASDVGLEVLLDEGDIRALPFADGFFDLAVCIRFLNLIDSQFVDAALRELVRVSRDKVLIGIRYLAPISDLRAQWVDLVGMLARRTGFTQYLAHRWKVVLHDKAFVTGLLDDVGVHVVHTNHLQRRWDGTDYLILLVEKQASARRCEGEPPDLHAAQRRDGADRPGRGSRA